MCVCTCDAQCSFSVSDAMLNGFLSGMEISPREGFWIDPKLVLKNYYNKSMFDPEFVHRDRVQICNP